MDLENGYVTVAFTREESGIEHDTTASGNNDRFDGEFMLGGFDDVSAESKYLIREERIYDSIPNPSPSTNSSITKI